jgi:hypothetical protein
MLDQISTSLFFRSPPNIVMNHFSTPALLTRFYPETYSVVGPVDGPLQQGHSFREFWRLDKPFRDMPSGTVGTDGNQFLVGAEWTCVQRIDHSAYRIEGRYLGDGRDDPIGDTRLFVNYLFFPTNGGGTDLLRLWVRDSPSQEDMTARYVAVLKQIRESVDGPPP